MLEQAELFSRGHHAAAEGEGALADGYGDGADACQVEALLQAHGDVRNHAAERKGVGRREPFGDFCHAVRTPRRELLQGVALHLFAGREVERHLKAAQLAITAARPQPA